MSQDRSETRVRRDVARRTARLQRRAQQHTATPRATDAKKTWGEIDRPGSAALPAENLEDSLQIGHTMRDASPTESMEHGFPTWPRYAGSFGRRGAARQRGPHQVTLQDTS